MHVRDISIAKYNGFCCLQKFYLFPKIEYHSLFFDLFIFYIFSENVWQYFWKYEKSRYSNSEMWVAPGLPNGQGQRDGAGAWAEGWDKGEGARGWGGGLGQGVGQGLGWGVH